MAIVPHCGECRAETSANIACQPLDHHYQIYYCTGCGAVYSIVSKPTLPETTPAAPRDVLTSVKTPLKESPICPQHNLPLQKKTVPAGKKDAGKTFWVCPRVKECHQYREISPEPDILDTHRLILAEVGEADLSNKEAVTPERMQAKMRAAQLFRTQS